MTPIPPGSINRLIRPGDRVTILVHAGIGRNGPEWKKKAGRAVIVYDTHAVLNMGGRYGTPGVADHSNIVKIRRAA